MYINRYVMAAWDCHK